ncbi:hypothetical protein [Actinomycetospora sp. CA-084318]|uniref:hypothetical protein n=1 Tax=Actinomycetospora sp. CA-084318 TaxID=3239892 RepID=UPI003D974E61
MPPGPYAAPTPRASDPTVLSTGQVVPRQAMPVADVGDSFSVDLASAPRVLQELRTARDRLQDLRQEARFLGKIDPGTQDEVSRDAAAVFGAVAVGGPGSLIEALDGGVRRLDALISATESELTHYRASESAQVDRFDADA